MDKIQEIRKSLNSGHYFLDDSADIEYLLAELDRVKEDRASWIRVAERLQSEADAANRRNERLIERLQLSDREWGAWSDASQRQRQKFEQQLKQTIEALEWYAQNSISGGRIAREALSSIREDFD